MSKKNLALGLFLVPLVHLHSLGVFNAMPFFSVKTNPGSLSSFVSLQGGMTAERKQALLP